jgi:hypothetical protein
MKCDLHVAGWPIVYDGLLPRIILSPAEYVRFLLSYLEAKSAGSVDHDAQAKCRTTTSETSLTSGIPLITMTKGQS